MSSSPDQRRDGKRFRGSYEALEKLVQASPAANKNDIPLFAPSLPRPVSVSDILTTIHIDTSAINDERNNEAHKLPGETFNVKTGIIKQDKFTTTEEKCAAVKIALQQALEATKESGELPALDYPALKVAPATEAQKKKVGDKLVLCTAAALAVAGVANKVKFMYFIMYAFYYGKYFNYALFVSICAAFEAATTRQFSDGG